MKLALVQQRTLWWPTSLGWACLAAFSVVPGGLWWFGAEAFLAQSRPQAGASVLVVEGWIGYEGLDAAKEEFLRGDYSVLVATGGPTESRWAVTRSNYAEMAGRELLRLGLPEEKIWVARSLNDDSRRTYGMALAAKSVLLDHGVVPKGINVFTLGPHARRSRLVYAKVLRPLSPVGCLAWLPAKERNRPWWVSSERSKDLINETAGFLFELMANSGRGFGG